MTYHIRGLDAAEFQPIFNLDDNELARRGILRLTADTAPGFPCRISLEDASVGEIVYLLNYESHKTRSPYRSAYAIYVRGHAKKAAHYKDQLPPVLIGRPIALRFFDNEGLLVGADLDISGELAQKIEKAFDNESVSYIHAHNAMHGCFAAQISRH